MTNENDTRKDKIFTYDEADRLYRRIANGQTTLDQLRTIADVCGLAQPPKWNHQLIRNLLKAKQRMEDKLRLD